MKIKKQMKQMQEYKSFKEENRFYKDIGSKILDYNVGLFDTLEQFTEWHNMVKRIVQNNCRNLLGCEIKVVHCSNYDYAKESGSSELCVSITVNDWRSFDIYQTMQVIKKAKKIIKKEWREYKVDIGFYEKTIKELVEKSPCTLKDFDSDFGWFISNTIFNTKRLLKLLENYEKEKELYSFDKYL